MKTLIFFVLFILISNVSAALFSLRYESTTPNHLTLQTNEGVTQLPTGRMSSIVISLLQYEGAILVSIKHESLATSFDLKYSPETLRLRADILGTHETHLSFQDTDTASLSLFDGFQMELDITHTRELHFDFVGDVSGSFEVYFEEAVPEPFPFFFLLCAGVMLSQRNRLS